MTPALIVALALYALCALGCTIICLCAIRSGAMTRTEDWTPEPMRPIVDGLERDPYPEVPQVSGDVLDYLADLLNIKRKPGRRLWYTLWLKRGPAESDASLRARVLDAMRGVL